jgi:hypothetical protein
VDEAKKLARGGDDENPDDHVARVVHSRAESAKGYEQRGGRGRRMRRARDDLPEERERYGERARPHAYRQLRVKRERRRHVTHVQRGQREVPCRESDEMSDNDVPRLRARRLRTVRE